MKLQTISRNKKIIGVAVIWLIVMYVLYITVGQHFSPEGGIDAIGAILFYHMVWQFFIYAPPILLCIIVFLSWLRTKNLKFMVCTLVAIPVIVAVIHFGRIRFIESRTTPDYVLTTLQDYASWREEREKLYDGPYSSEPTECDYICDYVYDVLISETINEVRHAFPEQYQEIRKEYFDYVLERTASQLPGVTKMEFVPSIKELLPDRSHYRFPPKDDEDYLLDHRDFIAVAEHFGYELNRKHYSDRYHFDGIPASSENLYSNSYYVVIYYDDETIDLVSVIAGHN